MQQRPFIVGVLNITPDSFSDGGRYTELDAARRKAAELLEEGADVIDIGAESTRPGAKALSPTEEWERLNPILEALCAAGLGKKLSIDTRNEANAKRIIECFEVGWLNNVSGLYSDETMRLIAAQKDLRYVAMHMHKDPENMQHSPLQGSAAVQAVTQTFATYSEQAARLGLKKEQLYLDPGIGFGKDIAGNLQLLGKIPEWCKSYQCYLGVSRKSFLGKLLNIEVASERDAASKTLEFGLILLGARAIRTHWVKPIAEMCKHYFGE